MASASLPDMNQKQKILFAEDTPPKTLIDLAQRFVEAGWFADAIDFFERAEHREGLEAMRHKALEEGDVFILRRCLRALDEEAPPEEWKRLADRAHALGKLQFAREGYRLAGDRKGMSRIDLEIAPASADQESDPSTTED